MGEATQQTLRRTAQATGKDVSLWYRRDENKFKCPCHGSGFYRDGTNFEGPAPRPLDRIKIALTMQGQLGVDKGVVHRMAPGRAPDEQYAQSLLKV
jgi:hypothetical protein